MAAGLGAARAEPGVTWRFLEPGAAAQATPVARPVEEYRPTAIMVVRDDVVVATSLDRTMAQLGVDDLPPSLTPEEKQATVRQLLMSRSGVYHPAAYETQDGQGIGIRDFLDLVRTASAAAR